jgi:hypothetical protein
MTPIQAVLALNDAQRSLEKAAIELRSVMTVSRDQAELMLQNARESTHRALRDLDRLLHPESA